MSRFKKATRSARTIDYGFFDTYTSWYQRQKFILNTLCFHNHVRLKYNGVSYWCTVCEYNSYFSQQLTEEMLWILSPGNNDAVYLRQASLGRILNRLGAQRVKRYYNEKGEYVQPYDPNH